MTPKADYQLHTIRCSGTITRGPQAGTACNAILGEVRGQFKLMCKKPDCSKYGLKQEGDTFTE